MRHGDKVREGSLWQRNTAELISLLGEGWIHPLDTWTYSSATAITIPAGGASKYNVGDRIRLKQGGSYKYFYIVGVSDTGLDITGGTSYTLANDTITDNYYSHYATPLGFPHHFEYTPTFTGFSGAPTVLAHFNIIGRRVFYHVRQVSDGTSNATGFTCTLPVPAHASYGAIQGGNVGVDNGVIIGNVLAQINAGGTTATLTTAGGTAAWTAANAKSATISINYPI